jgi:hypothetical protein
MAKCYGQRIIGEKKINILKTPSTQIVEIS